MCFCTLYNENLFSEMLCFLYRYVYITNVQKIWFCYKSLKTAAYLKISYNSFYGKKKVQAFSHVAVPFDVTGVDESDMGRSKAKPKRKYQKVTPRRILRKSFKVKVKKMRLQAVVKQIEGNRRQK